MGEYKIKEKLSKLEKDFKEKMRIIDDLLELKYWELLEELS